MKGISVISTVFNESGNIKQLIESLLNQSLAPSEIVIVDGGSTDGTWELLHSLAARNPLVKAIRDESCNLRKSPGPIARGRNVAIRASIYNLIACADAGCFYKQEWLANLVEPHVQRGADYVVGGSYVPLDSATIWDIAAAPFIGFDLVQRKPGEPLPSTARSIAFTKDVWSGVGGFPEDYLLGEDSEFDEKAFSIVGCSYAQNASALYHPRFNFSGALRRLGSYAAADGSRRLRLNRQLRMMARCGLFTAGIALVVKYPWVLAASLLTEAAFAFRRDANLFVPPKYWKVIPIRLLVSILVPWIVSINYLRGALRRSNQVNEQNKAAQAGSRS